MSSFHTFLFGAESLSSLTTLCYDLHQLWLLGDLDKMCEIACITGSYHPYRVGIIGKDWDEVGHKLSLSLKKISENQEALYWDDDGIYYQKSVDLLGSIVALFSGQGSQYVGMGRDLFTHYDQARSIFKEMDLLFEKEYSHSLSSITLPSDTEDSELLKKQAERLQLTEFAQPAIGVMSAGCYKIVESLGFTPDFTAGHSFGELTALWAAKVFSDHDYLTLAMTRGRVMSPPNDPSFDGGVMMAVRGELQMIEGCIHAIPDVKVANVNSPNQVVIAGTRQGVLEAQALLKESRLRGIMLPVSAAFHTALVGHAQKPFAEALSEIEFCSPQSIVYSNATALPYPQESDKIQEILSQHILETVQFVDEIRHIYDAGGRVFIEFGPKNILSNLVKSILGDLPHQVIAVNPDPNLSSVFQLEDAILRLRVAGMILTKD